MEKRTWHYVLEPYRFEMHCDKCKGANITWSEFARKIWCYDCEIDTEGFGGIFDGPIPINCAEMLGLSFDIYNIETKKIEHFDKETNDYIELTNEEMNEKYKRIEE